MIKPKRLKKSDKVAIVSLSSGCIGDENNIARYERGKRILEERFGLEVIAMPNALKGTEYVYEHPELRAKDLMDAFKDDSIKAIITTTGGEETIRILPYIDYEVIKNNPKIFMGFSDTTANHFMMRKAGLISYYGPALAVEFSLNEQVEENLTSVYNTLFEPKETLEFKHYGIYANDPLDWSTGKLDIHKDNIGYEVLQGKGKVKGELIGGCLELLTMINGTEIWPKKEEWKDKILCIETSDEQPEPNVLKHALRNLEAQGILKSISGIMFGRPKNGKYYEEYKVVFKRVLEESNNKELPVITNCHFGHSWLWNIIPFGCKLELDLDNKKITLLEKPTE